MGYVVSLNQVEKRFVYGTIRWPTKKGPLAHPPGSGSQARANAVAIEILREYSANELLGKLYIMGAGERWTPASFAVLEQSEWYKFYLNLGPEARNATVLFHFEMEGSGRWKVLHFRAESDNTGPYVAVALQYVGPLTRARS